MIRFHEAFSAFVGEQIANPPGPASTQPLILDVRDWQVDNFIPPLLSIFGPPVTIIEKGSERIMFRQEYMMRKDKYHITVMLRIIVNYITIGRDRSKRIDERCLRK